MNKIVSLFAALALLSTPVAAADPKVFFQKSFGHWDVIGVEGDGVNISNNSCFARTKWGDGSYFAVIQDVRDGEMYIDMMIEGWNITDAPGTTGDLNMYYSGKSGNQTVQGSFVVLGPKTIRMPNMDIKFFLEVFDKYSSVDFIMPGNVPKVPMSLKGSSTAIGLMVECLETEKGLSSSERNPKNKYQESVPKQKAIIDPSKPTQDM